MPKPSLRPGLAVLVACGGVALACGGLQREHGVLVSNTLDAPARAELDRLDLVEDGEQVLAFYDATVTMDGSDVALITDRRLVTAKQGRATATDLADIESIEHTTDVVGGDRLLVLLADGGAMEVTVAPFNGGELFQRVLERARTSRLDATAPGPAAAVPAPAP